MYGHREGQAHRDRCAHASCGCGGHFQRHFATREERIARLEQYLQDLQAEAKAVGEHLAEMKAGR